MITCFLVPCLCRFTKPWCKGSMHHKEATIWWGKDNSRMRIWASQEEGILHHQWWAHPWGNFKRQRIWKTLIPNSCKQFWCHTFGKSGSKLIPLHASECWKDCKPKLSTAAVNHNSEWYVSQWWCWPIFNGWVTLPLAVRAWVCKFPRLSAPPCSLRGRVWFVWDRTWRASSEEVKV
jgi:hypothetical protein